MAARGAAQAKDQVAGMRVIGGRRDGDADGQSGSETAEIEARARSDDEVTGEKQVIGPIPAGNTEEGVGAHEEEKLVRRGKCGLEGAYGVNGVVGAAVGAGRVDERELKAGLAPDGKIGHRDAVGKAGLGPVALEGLDADRGENDAIEGEAVHAESREGDVAAVGWIETTTKEADPHCF